MGLEVDTSIVEKKLSEVINRLNTNVVFFGIINLLIF